MAVVVRTIRLVCTAHGAHRRTVLGRLENLGRDLPDWVAWNSDRLVDPDGRGRWDCPRCPLDVKWTRETVQRYGERLSRLPADADGVSEADLSLLPATLA